MSLSTALMLAGVAAAVVGASLRVGESALQMFRGAMERRTAATEMTPDEEMAAVAREAIDSIEGRNPNLTSDPGPEPTLAEGWQDEILNDDWVSAEAR